MGYPIPSGIIAASHRREADETAGFLEPCAGVDRQNSPSACILLLAAGILKGMTKVVIKIEDRPTPPWVREPVKVEPSVSDRRVKNAIKVLCERYELKKGQSVRIRVEGNTIVCG